MRRLLPRVVSLFVVPALAAIALTAAARADATPGQGALRITGGDGAVIDLPLRHTDVQADIAGPVARVEVTQLFQNTSKRPIEAVYVFPLPDMAAVDDMLIEIGPRRIEGEIKPREEARAIYEQARAEGYVAALLDQERPNVFTQQVANLVPGAEVKVRIRYVERLRRENGRVQFNFPMVVGPRYVPASHPVDTGGLPATRNLQPGERGGNDIMVRLDIDAGIPIRAIESPSHAIEIARDAPSRAHVSLARHDRIPNKDLMVEWSVAGDVPEVGLLSHRTADEGFFLLTIEPPADPRPEQIVPREFIFVMDVSGSMHGAPLEMSKDLARRALEQLGPHDTINIVQFAGSTDMLADAPIPVDDEGRRRARAFIDGAQGAGGTEFLAGMAAAFAQPHDDTRLRVIVFLSDGFIGNDTEVIGRLQQVVGDARVFSLGIGSSVNHYLMSRLGAAGRGAYLYVRPDGDGQRVIDRFWSYVSRPVLTDITVDWGTLAVADVAPEPLPDLFAGQPITLLGRYLRGGADTVIVRGQLGGLPWEKHVTVHLPEQEPAHEALASLWARGRIEDLTLGDVENRGPDVDAQVLALALRHRLMTDLTSFVAVDDAVRANPGGKADAVAVPLPMPEFVSFESVFGGTDPVAWAEHRGGVRPERPEELPRPVPPLPVAASVTRPVVRPVPAPAPAPPAAPSAPPQKATTPAGVRGMVVVQVIDDEGFVLPGAMVEIEQAIGWRANVTDANGLVQMSCSTKARPTIKVSMAGFSRYMLKDTACGVIRVRLSAQTVEAITVTAKAPTVDVCATTVGTMIPRGAAAPAAARDKKDGTEGAQSAVGGFEDALSARRGAGADAVVLTLLERSPATRYERRLAAAALRVLADLAEDRVLSSSDGRPALAALLTIADESAPANPRVAALVAWALAEASHAEKGLAGKEVKVVADGAKRALSRLERLSATDPASALLARLARTAAIASTAKPGQAERTATGEAPRWHLALAALLGSERATGAGATASSPVHRLIAALPAGHLAASAALD